jgi:hypothetical protein
MYGRTDNINGRRDTDAVRGGRAVRPECPSSISPCCPAHLDRFERCVCVALLLGNTSRGERIFRPRCAARACDVHLWRGASRAFRMAKVVFTLRGGVQHGLAVGCGKRAGTEHKGGHARVPRKRWRERAARCGDITHFGRRPVGHGTADARSDFRTVQGADSQDDLDRPDHL